MILCGGKHSRLKKLPKVQFTFYLKGYILYIYVYVSEKFVKNSINYTVS